MNGPARSWSRSPGAALVEILIALLLTATAVCAVMGALVSTSMESAGDPVRQRAALALNGLLEDLRGYVTADTARQDTIWCDTRADGALSAGEHDVTGCLDPGLAQRGARMTYTVTAEGELKRVTGRIIWTPPQ